MRAASSTPWPRGAAPSDSFTILGTGQSNSVSVGESVPHDLAIDENIWVWSPRRAAFVEAVYGTEPLDNKARDGSQAANHQVAFANALRRSSMLAPAVPIRVMRVGAGGACLANWVALKRNKDGQIEGQFVLNRIWETILRAGVERIDVVLFHQGESDSIGARYDAYEGGRFAADGFGNQATDLVPDAVNPVHPHFGLPQSVVAAITEAGGFNTPDGYAAAHRHLVALLRSLPQMGPTTPIICAELTHDWKTASPARNDYFTSLAAGEDPFLLVASSAGLGTSPLPNQANHLTSAAQNRLGWRMFAKWAEGAASSGLGDLYGNKIANRYALHITANADRDGRRQGGPDHYRLSTDQLRNGASVIVQNSTVVLPFRLGRSGGVDVEFLLRATSDGPSSIASRAEIPGLLEGRRDTIGGVACWRYTASKPTVLRLTSGFGGWYKLFDSTAPALARGDGIGGTAVRITLPEILPAAGALELAGRVDGSALPPLRLELPADPVQCVADFANAMRAALAAVAADWQVRPLPQLRSIQLSGPCGSRLELDPAGTGIVDRGRRSPLTERHGILLLAEEECANAAYDCAAGLVCVLPAANSAFLRSFASRIALVAGGGGGAPGDFGLDTVQGTAILDGAGTVHHGTGGERPSLVVAGNGAVLLEPLLPGRWVVLNGTGGLRAGSVPRTAGSSALAAASDGAVVEIGGAGHLLVRAGAPLRRLTIALPARPDDATARTIDFAVPVAGLGFVGARFAEGFGPPGSIGPGERLYLVFSAAAGGVWLCTRSRS